MNRYTQKEKTVRKIMPILFLFLIGFITPAYGTQPLDMLQKSVQQAMDTLKDPRYQDETQKGAQREKIWEIIREIFDLREMAKRTLGRNWKRFTPEQRKEFSEVFGEFIGNRYLEKIQRGFKNEEVVYVSQEMVTDSKAYVKTKILRETIEIPVNYSMIMRNGTWKVYDVIIEGVSLMKNYRTQINKILTRKSPDQLIEQLKKKIEQ